MALKILTLLLDWFVVIAMAVAASIDIGFGTASEKWPTAPAKLVKAEVIQKRLFLGLGSHDEPSVSYTYTANGLNCESNRIRFGGPSWMDADKAAEQFRTAPLTAHFNPKDPKISCLETGFNKQMATIEGAIGFVFLIIAFLETRQLKARLRQGKPKQNESPIS